MTASALPPFTVLSNSSSARKPFLCTSVRVVWCRSAAEQLATIVYRSIAVTIQHQESVFAADCGPRETIGSAVVIEIEIHAVRETRQVISIPCNVNDDWRLVTVVTLAVRKDPLAIRKIGRA